MSVDFLAGDRRHLHQRSGSEPDAEPELEPSGDFGEWPEQIDVRAYADTSLTIPGQSEPPGDCGTWGPREFCGSCGDVHLGPHKCQRRLCKDCWLTWRGNRAEAATARLAGARRAAEGAGKRLVHCIASPDVGEIRTINDFEKAKRKSYDIAKEKGVRGGILVPHGWTATEETKEAFRELKDADLVDGGIWKWIREHDRDWRSMTKWSPHYHIIGLAEDVAQSDPENDDGWIFKRIDSFPPFNLYEAESYRDMFKCTSYLLSHVGYETDGGKQAVRWFGELANNKFSLEQLADWEESKIKRTVAKIAGTEPEDDDGEGRECDECGVRGQMNAIFQAGNALMNPNFCEKIGREKENRLSTAFEWAIGDIRPPPGAQFPQTEEGAQEAFELLL